MEFNPEIFSTADGVRHWLFVFATFSAILLLVAFVLSLLTRGLKGPELFGTALAGSVKDLVQISLKRVLAIASLTFKEAIRRKALFIFVVFCILFMFAGWFLTRGGDKPQLQVKLYISFVLTSITWLLLIVMLLLSCWGIPEDIRLRSLHTVVTKPVRRVEIVIGRIFGFTGIGLLVLAVMSVTGYVWIQRQLSDRQKEVLTCRVPVYGPLDFLSETGQPNISGVNVGDTWMYRSYIMGTSQARAIWTFEGLTPERIGDQGLTLESNFEAFRTHKGNMDAGGLVGQYTLVNNRRAETFAELATSNNFQTAADYLRLAQYQRGADALRVLGNKLKANQVEFAPPTQGIVKQGKRKEGELELLTNGFAVASRALGELKQAAGQPWVTELTGALTECQIAASDAREIGQAAGDYTTLGDAVIDLSEKIEEHQASMREYLSRLSVPLPSFVVREYRFGENVLKVPAQMTFAPNNEDIARFLTKHVSELSENNMLVVDGALPDDLGDRLSEGELLTLGNAEQSATGLRELLAEGKLKIEGDKLLPADGTTMFSAINSLIGDGRLSAEDGWELTTNLSDLLHEGSLRVEVACLSRGQFLGMARPDLFIRLPDRPFWHGYFKAVASIGMMMIMIVTIGVCSSCFVKGPIAIFLTVSLLMIGQPISYKFMDQLVNQEVAGGGFVEAVIRMAKQLNPTVPLGINEKVEKVVNIIDDKIIFGGLRLVKNLIPQFGRYTEGTHFVENGFDVPFDACLKPGILTLFGFVVPCILIGFIALRFRELEAK